jgi:Tfp pilus assembly protein PilE
VVVLVIVGLVAAVAIPTYFNLRRHFYASDSSASLRTLVRSVDRYRADHGTYVGMTPALLRATYDPSLDARRYSITTLSPTGYCATATVHGVTASKAGPGTRISTAGSPCS